MHEIKFDVPRLTIFGGFIIIYIICFIFPFSFRSKKNLIGISGFAYRNGNAPFLCEKKGKYISHVHPNTWYPYTNTINTGEYSLKYNSVSVVWYCAFRSNNNNIGKSTKKKKKENVLPHPSVKIAAFIFSEKKERFDTD